MSGTERSPVGGATGAPGSSPSAQQVRRGGASGGQAGRLSLARSLAALLWEDDRVLHLEAVLGDPAELDVVEVPGVEVEETTHFDRPLPPEVRSYLRSNRYAGLTDHHGLFVATIEGEVAGITALGRDVVRCHGRRQTVRLEEGLGYSYATFVAADARNRGVGRALLRFMLRHASFLGLRRVYAIIHPRNSASLGLYQRNGFAVTGAWRFRRVAGFGRTSWIPLSGDSPGPRKDDSRSGGVRRETSE